MGKHIEEDLISVVKRYVSMLPMKKTLIVSEISVLCHWGPVVIEKTMRRGFMVEQVVSPNNGQEETEKETG